MHYDRWRNNGDPLIVQSVRGASTEDRFWFYVRRGAPSECWPWTGTVTHEGYGVFATKAGPMSQVKAHRMAYELLVGPIPAGLTLDHICHNVTLNCVDGADCEHRRCVNPAHLEPVTAAENTRRANEGRNLRRR